ncbi:MULTISPECIES: hypothetical protein [Catenuloplanes]|uniref:Uncharacterized protein n=1 Tax=Catenuloplanes niger TaxID=587534 RepID=A0AAE3ZI09_9ACTN|nr:hypothetical protein [Catenuloplanes niger]MDR7320268.1 hypothetical protein [Catenuloplanes niger]
MRIGFAARLIAAVTVVLVAAPAPAYAYEPVEVVHTERVQAGPYAITVGFSRWPVRAMQSLDFSFIPDGGLTGKSGTLEQIGPGIEDDDVVTPLARHPRKRDVWGLDIAALPAESAYTFRFTVDGPAGRGVGELRDIPVVAQPGPPLGLSWAVAVLPLLAFLGFMTVAWRRVRPSRHLTLLD